MHILQLFCDWQERCDRDNQTKVSRRVLSGALLLLGEAQHHLVDALGAVEVGRDDLLGGNRDVELVVDCVDDREDIEGVEEAVQFS